MSSNDSFIPVVVLCSSEESAGCWIERGRQLAGLTISPIYPASSAWNEVREQIIRNNVPTVVCQEYVWFGSQFAAAVKSLVADLERQFPLWGACGNRGCTWEGSLTYNYTTFSKDEGSGLDTSILLKTVISIDDNLVLVNSAALQKAQLVDLGFLKSKIFGIMLSLECLRHHFPLLVDARLFTVRTESHSAEAVSSLTCNNEFKTYYRANFLNHTIPWPDSPVDVSHCVDYAYLADSGHTQVDILNLFDKSLVSEKASLTVCCRTQFNRMELLKRAMSSFMVLSVQSAGFFNLQLRLISDVSNPSAVEILRRDFPAVQFECWVHQLRPPRHSRTDLLLAAIERAETDYIWFVDDDDYVLPGAAQALARTLLAGDDTLVIGNSWKVEEHWSVPEGERELTLVESKRTNRFENRNVFKVFSGANHIPICSLLLPVRKVRNCLADKQALGNYNEDYFVLLSTLTAPRTDVRLLDADICAVSFRGTLNTVSEIDRSAWHASYATFIEEILRGKDANPIIWQMAKWLQRR